MSTEALISHAEATGQISATKAVVLLATAIRRPEQLPQRYRSTAPWDGTLALMRIKAALPTLAPSARREITDGLALGLDDCLGSPPTTHKLLTPHFSISYVPPLIGGGLTVDDYAAALEETWAIEIGGFGWVAPPFENGRYPVVIDPSASAIGLYGFVSTVNEIGDNPNSAWNDTDAFTSCMGLAADYTMFPGTPLAAMPRHGRPRVQPLNPVRYRRLDR